MRVLASFLILYLMGLAIIHAYRILFVKNASTNPLLYLLLCLPLLLYVYSMVSYLNVDTFRQHVEPTIVIQAQLFAAGQEIYTTLNAADRFSLQYGPTTYILTSAFLSFFDNPILASKVYGIALSLFSLGILFFTIHRKFSAPIAFMAIVYSLITYLLLAEIPFRNQADSLLLFSVITALSGIFSKQKNIATLLIALGITLAANSKAHAVVYFIPIIYLHFHYHGKNSFIGTIILTAILSSSIFLLPQFNLTNYIFWLTSAAKHGFNINIFGKNIAISLLFIFPAILLYRLNHASLKNIFSYKKNNNIESTAFTLLIGSMFVISAIASKNGAGIHHILPFAPIIAIFIAYFINDLSTKKIQAATKTKERTLIIFILILAWVFAIGADIVKEQKRYFIFISQQKNSTVLKDIINLKKKYQKYVMYMGYSDKKSYPLSYYRPIIFSAKQGNLLDPVALMDMETSGMLIPNATNDKLASQVYDIILIPKGGKPFSMKNEYRPNPLFGSEIPAIFVKNYTHIETSDFYEVWASNKLKPQL